MGSMGRTQEGLELAESRLRHRGPVGIVVNGLESLGVIPQSQFTEAHGKDKRHLVQEEVQLGVEEVRTSRMVSMQQQEAQKRWAGALEMKLTWNDIWKSHIVLSL